jgi:hypothetical protein
MISLKKHIDGWVRSSDVSGLGKSPEPSRPALTAKQWAEQALQRLEANEREMKEIIDIMARAVQSLAERDERCARQVGDIAQRLRSVAGLMDLARIRQSILEGASSLTACVRQITQDGRESLLLVATKVEDYRSRLDKPENGLSHLTPPEPVAGTGVDPNWNPAAAQWVERASRRLGANRRELREIVFVIERAVESVTGRDERYDSEAGGIAQRLRSIAGLGNITDIRHGVIDNATLLTACGRPSFPA